MNKVLICACGVAITLLASCGGNGLREDHKDVLHNVFLVSPQAVDGVSVRDFSGRVEEARSVSAAFKTGGPIERLYVKEGDRVRRGQLLAELDSADYVLGINQLRVQHSQFATEFARMTRLYATGGVSDNDYEKAKAGLEQLAYQLALQENKLAYCRLLAPVDGVVTDAKFEPGELVDAGTPVFDLMDNTRLEVVVDLPVGEYMRRDDFQSFTGRSTLLPGKTFALSMLSLTPKADNNQLFQLKLTVGPDADVALTPGMNVGVAITMAGGGSGAVAVPVQAVFDFEGRPAVYVYDASDSTVRATPVTLSGTGADGYVTVTSGLDLSQRIVRAGVHHLTQGEKVNVITPASDSNVGNLL